MIGFRIQGLNDFQSKLAEGAMELILTMMRQHAKGELKCPDGSNPTSIWIEIDLNDKNTFNDIVCVVR